MGTPASIAIRVAPCLKGSSSSDGLMVASGKTPTISPARRASTAALYEAAPASRSTGM